jgi:CRISPR system Cascade subunit CasC
MERFVQLHLLTSYPPANLNRDDLGRPKTAYFGGSQRLRISSQCLKRNWRTSETFRNALGNEASPALSEGFLKALEGVNIVLHPHIGVRTKDLGIALYQWIREARTFEETEDTKEKAKKIKEWEAKAAKWAQDIAGQFGKLQGEHKPKKDEPKKEFQIYQIEQLVHLSPDELMGIDQVVQDLLSGTRTDVKDELLRKEHQAVDIAMFGRMLAEKSAFNGEAAVQVAHAITVHEVAPEDDYFTAVDDLNLSPITGTPDADKGAGHIGENEFGAGLFYLYVCIDREELKRNLKGDEVLTQRALRGLTEAAIKVTPGGKRNSYAHHTYAHHVLAERGSQQPRSLAVAFLKPVEGKENWLETARTALEDTYEKMDKVYGACADARCVLDFESEKGSLAQLLDFVAGVANGLNKPDEGSNA